MEKNRTKSVEKFRDEVRRLTVRSYNLNQEVIKERARPLSLGDLCPVVKGCLIGPLDRGNLCWGRPVRESPDYVGINMGN